MKIDVLKINGGAKSQKDLPDEFFGVPLKKDLLNRVVVYQRAKNQTGQHSTKTIAFVRGGGRKPFRQKGTGRARQGSNRSAHHIGGATVFGPKPRSHAIGLPKKMRRLGLAMALSQRLREKRFLCISDDDLKKRSTSEAISAFKDLGLAGKKVLMIEDNLSKNLILASGNIPHVKCMKVIGANVYDILRSSMIVISESSLDALIKRLKGEHVEPAPVIAKTPSNTAGSAKKVAKKKDSAKKKVMESKPKKGKDLDNIKEKVA